MPFEPKTWKRRISFFFQQKKQIPENTSTSLCNLVGRKFRIYSNHNIPGTGKMRIFYTIRIYLRQRLIKSRENMFRNNESNSLASKLQHKFQPGIK